MAQLYYSYVLYCTIYAYDVILLNPAHLRSSRWSWQTRDRERKEIAQDRGWCGDSLMHSGGLIRWFGWRRMTLPPLLVFGLRSSPSRHYSIRIYRELGRFEGICNDILFADKRSLRREHIGRGNLFDGASSRTQLFIHAQYQLITIEIREEENNKINLFPSLLTANKARIVVHFFRKSEENSLRDLVILCNKSFRHPKLRYWFSKWFN